MKGWRSKLIFIFIVYFSGFATAVYMIASPPEKAQNENLELDTIQSKLASFDSREFIDSFNSGLHKSVYLGKGAALHLSGYIKEKAKNSDLFGSAKNETNR